MNLKNKWYDLFLIILDASIIICSPIIAMFSFAFFIGFLIFSAENSSEAFIIIYKSIGYISYWILFTVRVRLGFPQLRHIITEIKVLHWFFKIVDIIIVYPWPIMILATIGMTFITILLFIIPGGGNREMLSSSFIILFGCISYWVVLITRLVIVKIVKISSKSDSKGKI